jgi:hypothetical protein
MTKIAKYNSILINNENINSQNLLTPTTTTDPLTIGVLSAMAGAIAGAVTTEVVKKLLALNIQWRHKKAEKDLLVVSLIQSGKLILMTKRKPNPNPNPDLNNNLIWCFPAAKIRQSEIIVDRLKIRYEQKFKIEVKILQQIGESFTYSEGQKLDILYFHCQYDKGTVENIDTAENDKVEWIDVNDVEKKAVRVAPCLSKLLLKIKKS